MRLAHFHPVNRESVSSCIRPKGYRPFEPGTFHARAYGDRPGRSKLENFILRWWLGDVWRGRDALPRVRRCTSGKLPLLITPRNS
jgi:hypothetical protein